MACVRAEILRAEADGGRRFDEDAALRHVETDPFAWERHDVPLVLVWRCGARVHARLAMMRDMIKELTR